ncbi:MAG TPA: ZIP family metal transporter [Candidatus Doudnabacteria bacterium]|nr:ZIP family metal transporter [Candidatus Doudnabacteria bacterium]
MTTIYILLSAGAVMLVSLVGIFTTAKTIGAWAERNLKYLTTFATGVFILVAYKLVGETFHSDIEVSSILGIIALGMLAAYLVDKAIPHSHHHHDNTENPDAHSKSGAHRIVFSDALHNITDGFLIVPAFLIDIRLGILTTLGIMVHEVAQEISEFFVLKSAGYSTKQALTINFFTASTILIGAAIALLIANISEDLISVLLAIAAGIIIFTIFKDLIPHSVKVAQRDKTYTKHFLAALAGAILILGVASVTASTHIHHHDNEEHTHSETHDHAHNETEHHVDEDLNPAHLNEHAGENHHEDEHHPEDNHLH